MNNLKKSNFFEIKEENVKGKRNGVGISVIVYDKKTGKSYEFISISKAARFLSTYPKAIWRKVQNEKLFEGRYLIKVKNKNKGIKYNNVILKGNIIIISSLLIILVTSVLWNYLAKETIIDISYILDNEFTDSDDTENTLASQMVKGLVDFNKEWKSECLLRNKTSFITSRVTDKSTNISIFQYIANKINLDFNYSRSPLEINTLDVSPINQSTLLSPIIERVKINDLFNNAIQSLNTAKDAAYDTPLRIQTQGLHSNNEFINIEGLLMNRSPGITINRVGGIELLNYNSNVLYCLINGISPSIIK